MPQRKWTPQIAVHWRNYVPPCRPSRFELDCCSQILHSIRVGNPPSRPRVLILGSTTEFRDWAFEEAVDVTVVDNSREYHEAISEELTHHNPREVVAFQDWRDMKYQGEFDLALGDLVVGNLPEDDVPRFLGILASSLREGGRFITKSFFLFDESEPLDLEQAFKIAGTQHEFEDPFPWVIYELSMTCRDPRTGILQFETMHETVMDLARRGIVDEDQARRFDSLGWDSSFKVDFWIPTEHAWTEMYSAHFDLEKKYTPATSTALEHFPLYVLRPLTVR